MTVLLDGNAILDRETLHETLATGLCLPPWYGRNLDALYDCLTDVREDTVVVLRDRGALEEHLGSYGHRCLRVLEDASRDNPHIRLETIEVPPEK